MRGFLVFVSFMFVFLGGCSNSTQKPVSDSDVERDDIESFDSDQDPVFGEIVQNPSGNVPLSAEIELFTDGISEVEVEVHDIIEEVSSFLRKYEIGSFDQEIFHIPVVGLFPDHKNRVTVKVFDDEGKIIEKNEFEIETDKLPYDFPEVTVSGDIESGWTIVNYLRTPRSRPEMNAMAVDEFGRIRWFTDMPYPAVFPIRLHNGYIYLSDGADILYKYDFMGFEKGKWDVSEFGFTEIHHDIFIKNDGNILLAVSKIDDGWSYDRIIEIDPEKNTLRGTWDLKTIFPDVCDLYHDIPMTEAGNPQNGANAPIHNNAVWHDPSDDSLIIASQRSGVAKLTHSGYLKWFLAPHITAYIDDADGDGMSDSLADGYDPDDHSTMIGDFKGENYTEDRMPIAGKPHEVYSSFDFRYQEFLLDPLDREGNLIEDEEILMGFANHKDFVWPFRVHSPVILENGNMMLFDNGLARNFSFPPISSEHYSRAVEFKIISDESDGYGGTVEQVWEYVVEESPLWYGFSPVVSNVEELENGNRLVVSGSLGSSFIPD
ncbi:MAG TPA: hypothetical protein ENN58_03365, partial [bacterium]|nr:hypothetical protein [bacterium]